MPISLGATSTSPQLTLRIDTSGTAFGGSPTWTTYTEHLMARAGVQITWGRSDEQAEPAPRQFSFELSNASGVWTPGKAGTPAGWDVGARVRFTVTVDGVNYERADGYVDSIEPTWVGGVHTWNVVRVSCTDISARLALGQPLRSMVVQEMLADNPTCLYPLDEADGSTSAGDISVNRAAAAQRRDGKYGSGTVSFATDMGLADPTTGVQFGSTSPGDFDTPVSTLALVGGMSTANFVPANGAHTVSMWVVMPTVAPAVQYTLSLQTSEDGSAIELGVLSSGVINFYLVSPGTAGNGPNGTTSLCDGKLHHLVGTLAADQKTAKLYIDGVLISTYVSATTFSFADLRFHGLGGRSTSVDQGFAFPGTMANYAVYPSALSAARILVHYQAGKGALLEQSGARYARLAAYAGLTTTGLPTGTAQMGAQNTAGAGVTDALAKVARTEGTVSYVTGAGDLTFQDRTIRYNATAGLTLTAGQTSGTDPIKIRRDRQGLANEMTVSRDGGASQRYVDATSQAAIGRFDGGSLEVAPSTDADALNNAAWRVHTHKGFATRIPGVTVNLLGAEDSVRTAVLGAGISTLLTLTGLPSQAPASSVSLFIEGGSERIAYEDWEIDFFTSPNLPATLRADGTASALTALDAGLVIPF